MSEDGKRQVVNHYHINIQGAALGDQQHGTNISGSKIESVLAGAQALGAQPSSNAKSPSQPLPKATEIQSDTTTNRKIPMLKDELKERPKPAALSSRPHPVNPGKTSGGATEDAGARLNIACLRERCSGYLRNPKPDYAKATKLLEELAGLQQESEFDTMLQLAECYLHLGRERKADKVMSEIKTMIMTSQALNASDILTLAKDLKANSAHTRAMILFPIACDMFHANASSPDDAVNRMFDCIEQMRLSVTALINGEGRPKVIGTDGIEHMEDMYENISSVKNADPVNKALKEARALNWIGFRYNEAGESDKALKPRYRGLEILEQQFHGNKSMYQVYGHLLHNIGFAHYNLGNFTEAEKFYLKAVDAQEKATDFASESEKRDEIEVSRKSLNKTRAKLGKK